MFRRLFLVLLGVVAALCLPSFAQTDTTQPVQKMDPDYAASVEKWTTKPEFISPLVDHLPASTTVPSPKDVLGYWIGAPKRLTYYADILRYYEALAAHTGRVKVIRIGKTEEERDSVIVFVGSEDSIAHLDQERANLAKIADPRGMTEAPVPSEMATRAYTGDTTDQVPSRKTDRKRDGTGAGCLFLFAHFDARFT